MIESGVQLTSSDESIVTVTWATYDSITVVGVGTAMITTQSGDAPPIRVTLNVTASARED
ncbi:hypothetical protein PPOP_0580 [Paenibacillus popilliae ATCC 14706]|uniref:BIG2 domain-containing protein n=2 Tax=Paenibacillus popilliae TaxID=78057 RepID=M9LFT8_PAEPP|nr:hypothetical protein PPOP_0580 [Paenibacillus popilliae ATCC 14706]